MRGILVATYLSLIIIGTGLIQVNLKEKPQLILILLCAVTLLAVASKKRDISSLMLSLLIGIATYASTFLLSMFVKEKIWPNKPSYHNGVIVNFMDYSWFYAVVIGLLLAIIAAVLSYRTFKTDVQRLGAGFTGIMLLVTGIIFIIYEVL